MKSDRKTVKNITRMGNWMVVILSGIKTDGKNVTEITKTGKKMVLGLGGATTDRKKVKEITKMEMKKRFLGVITNMKIDHSPN